jgi:hypothetical protein
MSYSVSHQIGVDLNNIVASNPNSAGTSVPTFGPLGMEVFGSDGKLYVLAQAGVTITASSTSLTVNATTFQVTLTGGAYISPAVALAAGDYAWFGKASV